VVHRAEKDRYEPQEAIMGATTSRPPVPTQKDRLEGTATTGLAGRAAAHDVALSRADVLPAPARYLMAGLRLALGWVFLWAFLDKAFGLGRATPAEGAWISGGSPTEGFLANAPTGPFAGVFNAIAGAAWADWLFMLGLAGIGVALMLGIGTRVATVAGALMLLLMWAAVLPPANNPFMDDHLVYAGLLFLLLVLGAADVVGLGRRWKALPLVRRFPVLR
jgi:thiosulfate dehydrogenase [quinone] large subunit